MARERDNLKAGLFVLVGFVLAVAIVFILSDLSQLFEQQKQIKVYYRLSDGLLGLKEGAPVTLGDQPIGEVTSIEDMVEMDKSNVERVIGKIVSLSIPAKYQIYQNAVIELKAPLIGGGTSLNIRSVGDRQLYAGDAPIPGSVAGSAQVQELIREAGIMEEQRQQIRNIIANVESITATLRDDVPAITEAAKQASANLKEVTSQIHQLTTDFQGRREVWVQRIDGITASADQSLGMLRDLVKDKDPQLRQTLDNVHAITQTAREKILVQVDEAVGKAVAAVDSFKATMAEVQAMVVSQRPVLERALANVQLTSDQLKLTAIEVRRSPWRLLYDPDDREVATDNLYDAARSFVMAASMLDSTSQSLRALADKETVDQQQISQELTHLESVFSKFKEAEEKFWHQIKVTQAP